MIKQAVEGAVLEGGTGINAYGIRPSHEGDRVTCGKDGKTYQIVDGAPYMMSSEGKRLAGSLHSYSTCPCRARLISSMRTARYGAWGDELPEDSAFRRGHIPCNHSNRMEELASSIADEMNRNISHPSALEMKALNNYDPIVETKEYMAFPFYRRLGIQPDFHTLALAKRARALALWTERVGQNRPWDHKPIILAKFGGDLASFTADANRNLQFLVHGSAESGGLLFRHCKEPAGFCLE